MKVLILDHHFGQDIDSLRCANQAGHDVRTVSPYYFATRATRFFPEQVWGADFSAYHAAELEEARRQYRREAFDLLFDLYKIFSFDVFVSPSDTFFYIRDVIDACHDLGVPFVVVQKETGVSPNGINTEARQLRRHFPFRADWMTTCSAPSRQFWVAAGADPAIISVVGQPRFDLYFQPQRWSSLDDLGLSVPPGVTTVLFLSYVFDSYDERRGDPGHRPWESLHRDTEAVLRKVASSGRAAVLFKPHPQHDAQQLEEIHRRLGSSPTIIRVCGSIDTRQLILATDVVVGFQTTAMAEAVVCGKPTIYTFWTDAVRTKAAELLPFHDMYGIEVARSAEELEKLITGSGPTVLTDSERKTRAKAVEPYLGLVDGGASERVWKVLQEKVEKWASSLPEEARRRRLALTSEAPGYCARELRRARRRLVVRELAARVGTVLKPLRGCKVTRRLGEKRDAERKRVQECQTALHGEVPSSPGLVGRIDDNLFREALRFLWRRVLSTYQEGNG